jgi:poly [ADP-ribose] polymerase
VTTNIVDSVMLVCTDARNNNHKFWEGKLFDNGDVLCRWGRVGADGQSKTFPGAGGHFLKSKTAEKQRGGYREVSVLNSPKSQVVEATSHAVKSQIVTSGDPLLESLIDRLVKENRHEIFVMSGGQMNVSASGVIETAVGAIGASQVHSARSVLQRLAAAHTKGDFDSAGFVDSLNEYLMLVPQKVSSRRGWHTSFLAADDAIAQQSAFLDQLESSIALATQAAQPADASVPQVFDIQLSLLDDAKEWKRIVKFFESRLNRQHVSSSLKPVRAYKVAIGAMARAFEADGRKVGNIKELWHGTRAYNLLSIFKQGLIIPPTSGTSHVIAGRMFGDGVYFSDESSKSLNYSMGYWDRGSSYDRKCFMFLADVAMGREFTPASWSSRAHYPERGYDSTFAKGGQSGVRNNEMIVYRTSQANLTTLVEFAE